MGSLSGEGLKISAVADSIDVLASLDESGGVRQIEWHQRVLSDEGLPSGDVDRVLRSELQHSTSCGTQSPVSSDVDVESLGGPPSKSAMFDIENGSNTRESLTRKLPGMSIVGQVVPSSSQYGGTGYCTSELETVARRKADEPVGANVCVGSKEGFSWSSRTGTQPDLGTARTKWNPSYSARTL